MQNTRFIENEDFKIAVYETGLERDLYILFLHGNSENALIFKNQFNSSLKDNFHLLAIDLPGHGKSSQAKEPKAVYNLPYLRDYAGKLIEQINKPVVLAGSSFGGHLALEMAHLYPKNIKGVFIDGTPPLSSSADFANAFLPNPATACLFKEKISDEELNMLCNTCIADPDYLSFYKEMVRETDGQFRSFIFQSLLNNEMMDEKSIAGNSVIPIAILHGEKDMVINPEYYKSVPFKNLWQKKIHLIPHASHLPCLENATLYNNLLTQFVNNVWQDK
jgi:pimeloyl-ACP methyl ester carboxylesterase